MQHRLQLLEAKEEVRVRPERLIDEAIHRRDTVRRESEVVIQRLTDQLEEKSQQVEQLKRVGEDRVVRSDPAVEMQQRPSPRKETSQELREAPSDAADVSPTVSRPKGTTDAAELTVSVRDEALSGAGNVSDRRGIPPSDTRQVLDEHESSATVPTTAREEISATCVGVPGRCNGSERGLSGSSGMMPAINAAFSGLSMPRLNKFVGDKPDDDDGAD